MLDNKTLIREIAINDKDELVRQSALARLEDLNKKKKTDDATDKKTDDAERENVKSEKRP